MHTNTLCAEIDTIDRALTEGREKIGRIARLILDGLGGAPRETAGDLAEVDRDGLYRRFGDTGHW